MDEGTICERASWSPKSVGERTNEVILAGILANRQGSKRIVLGAGGGRWES